MNLLKKLDEINMQGIEKYIQARHKKKKITKSDLANSHLNMAASFVAIGATYLSENPFFLLGLPIAYVKNVQNKKLEERESQSAELGMYDLDVRHDKLKHGRNAYAASLLGYWLMADLLVNSHDIPSFAAEAMCIVGLSAFSTSCDIMRSSPLYTSHTVYRPSTIKNIESYTEKD